MSSDNLFDLMGRYPFSPQKPTTKAKPVLKTKVEQEVQPVPTPLSVLDQIWLDVLLLVKPFSTQMLLRQQCRLRAFDGWEARISTYVQPLFKMATDRLPNLEAAFAQLCDHPIQVSLEVAALDQIWLDVLPLVQPFPTQMMLRQQCRLLAFDGNNARIGTSSQPLLKMASDRLPNLEAAFTELCKWPIKVSLEVVLADEWMPAAKMPPEAATPQKPLSALDQIWQDVLPLVQPFSTQMMLRQQCRLLAFDGNDARMGTSSQPLLKMASDRLPNMEAAFAGFYNRPIKVSLEVVSADEWLPVAKMPLEAIAPPQPVTDLPRHSDWAGSVSQSRSDYGFFA